MNSTPNLALSRWLFPRLPLPFAARLKFVMAMVMVVLVSAVAGQAASGLGSHRRVFSNSITPMPPKVAATVRSLRGAHLAKTLEFEIPLQMRSYPKLLEKIGRGEVVSKAAMERDYLPLPGDYQKVLQWLRSQGFEITQTDPSRLSIFARGTMAQIQQAFQVEMVQVTSEGADYPSARTHPSLPEEIASPVLGINGLQPYLHLRKHTLDPAPNVSNQPPFTIKEVLGAYNAQNLGVSGSGQKIAILIDTVPSDSDLTGFWSYNNIPQSLSNIEKINVTGGSLPYPTGEETLDVEWTSGIAPKAKIRVYASGSLSFTNLDKALQRIISDLPNQPQLHQLSISLGLGESYLLSSSQMQTDAQFFASIASNGVSVFVSSGDAGSNPDSSGQGTSGPLQVEYYASDPSVTGVGGTNLNLNSTTGQVVSETGWAGSGGGVSQVFSRPSWQTGAGVASGSKRLVPDVSSVASDITYAYYYFGGKGSGVAGTSWSAPTWAGFCALMNEARAKASQGPLGLLNPKLYPLLGTANFRDIVVGSNGRYSAGAGYDMVTGLGVPSVATLLQTLAGAGSGIPSISYFSPTSGAVNTSVTIAGANLGRATAVSFNGANAAFTVNSSTQITATVPSGATTGPITVTTSGSIANSATSSGSFTVISGNLANDSFANAISLSGTAGSITATNIGATKQSGEPNHAGNAGGASVWFTWTAPQAGTYTFDTLGSSFDTLLGIYTGSSVSALTQVAANDDAGTGVTSSVSFVASAGTVYRIAVDGHDGQTGTISLHYTINNSTPIIDSFTPATGGPGTLVAINGANFSGASSVKFNGVNAVFDVISSTQITATVPAGASTGILTVTTPAGSTNSGAVFIFIQPPDNDLFAKPAILSGSSGTIAGSNVGAGKEAGEPYHVGNAGGSSVWYSWTAPATGVFSFNTFGSSFDTLLAVYTGTAVGALTQVAANDDSGRGGTSAVAFAAQAGTVYRIAIDGYAGAVGNIVLSWDPSPSVPAVDSFSPSSGPVGTSVVISGSHFIGATGVAFSGVPASYVVGSDTQIITSVPSGAATGPIQVSNLNGSGASASDFTVNATPPNDSFGSRSVLTGSSNFVNASNVGASKETGEPNIAGNAGGHSVWWSWTAPASGSYTISTLGSNFDTVLAVYTGTTLAGLSTVASNDDDPNGGVTSSVVLSATAGGTYQIAVDGVNGASGNILLSIIPSAEVGTLFSTGFEKAEGYTTGTTLGGQPSSSSSKWQFEGANGNGILSGVFAGMGQQAYLGKTRKDYQNTFVWKPVGYTPNPGDKVTFSVDMEIVDSTNGRWDDFQWQIYNSSGKMLFAMDFDNYSLEIGYFLADDNYYSTGAYFQNSSKYTLQVTLDYGSETWSASLNGKLLVSDAPLDNTGTASPIDFGDVDAVWAGSNQNYNPVTDNYDVRGDNYLVFDNYKVAKTSIVAPVIVLQPQSQSADAGSTVSLSVAALGSLPMSYQWQKNGTDIPGATASTLTLDNIQPADAGNYTVTVSNAGNTATSGTSKITIVNGLVATSALPVGAGNLTGAGLYKLGATATVAATANLGYRFANWTENGSIVSGSSSFSFVVNTGRNLVANFTPVYFTISAGTQPVGSGTVLGSGTYQEGRTASLSATPAPGFQFDRWTENGQTISSDADYQFAVTGNRQVVANFVPDVTAPTIAITAPTSQASFITVATSVTVLGTAADNTGVTRVEWANSLGGSGTASGTGFWSATGIPLQTGTNVLTLTAYDSAGNPGIATVEAIRIPPVDYRPFAGQYSGLLQTSGSNGTYNGLAKFVVSSSGAVNGSICFQHVSTTLRAKLAPDGTFSGNIVRPKKTPLTVALKADQTKPDLIVGTASDGTLSSSFTANRAVFSPSSNPCPYAGRYTLLLPPDPNAAGSPQGTGFATVTIGSGGNVRLSGMLPDGVSFSQGANLSKNGTWPIFVTAYGVAGAVAGPVALSGTGDLANLAGTIDWSKPARPKDAYFPAGFQTRLSVEGNRFTAPANGGFVIPLGTRALQIGDANVQLDKTVALSPPNQFLVQDPAADRLSLKISTSTGLLSGKFLLNAQTGQWVTLHGVILQGEDIGAGFFLENAQSGQLDLGTAVAP